MVRHSAWTKPKSKKLKCQPKISAHYSKRTIDFITTFRHWALTKLPAWLTAPILILKTTKKHPAKT